MFDFDKCLAHGYGVLTSFIQFIFV